MNAPCKDCGVETLPVDGRRAEWYMVKPDVWADAGMTTGFLCIGCLETRLGRQLTREDFTDCPVNNPSLADTPRYAFSYRTPRLVSRLTGRGAGVAA